MNLRPLTALSLKLLLFRRGLSFGVHFLFVVHTPAFSFWLSMPVLWLGGIRTYVMSVGWAAMRRVNGCTWWRGLWRTAVLTVMFGVLLQLVRSRLRFGWWAKA